MKLFKTGLLVRSPVNAGTVFELRAEHLYHGQFDSAHKTCFLCDGGHIVANGDYAVLVRNTVSDDPSDGDYSWTDIELAHVKCATNPSARQQRMMKEGGFTVCVFPK